MDTLMDTDDGPLCEITEMPQRWCHDCLHDSHRRVPIERRWRDMRSRAEVRHRFFANHPGTCPCGEAFGKGDYIGVTVDDEYLCEGCCG